MASLKIALTPLAVLALAGQLRAADKAASRVDDLPKVKVIAHRAYGFRKPETYITAIYHCCADLPLP